jgi:carbamoyl-phosphate synthase large subunit
MSEGSPNVVDLIRAGKVDLIINTPRSKQGRRNGYEIRRAAVDFGVSYITTIRGSRSRRGTRSRLLHRRMELEWSQYGNPVTHKTK